MQVFYVNIGGGEPTSGRTSGSCSTTRPRHQVGVKFSTNGVRITPAVAARLAATDYVDVQISLDGATAEVNDAVRGAGSYATAPGRWRTWPTPGCADFKISVVVHPAERRPARRVQGARRPATARSCGSPGCARRAAAPTCGTSCTRLPAQQRELYDWLLAHGEDVLTGDSFFHLAAFGEALPGLNLCGAGRVVCLIDPVGDVYACPFAIHDELPRRQRPLTPAASRRCGATRELFAELREPAVRRRLRVVPALRRLPRRLHGGQVLHRPAAGRARTRSASRATARPRSPPADARSARRGATATTRTPAPVRGQPSAGARSAIPATQTLRREPAGRCTTGLARAAPDRPAAGQQEPGIDPPPRRETGRETTSEGDVSSRARSPSSPARPAAGPQPRRSGWPQEGADIIAVDSARQIETVGYPMATAGGPGRDRQGGRGARPADRRHQADVRDVAALKAAVDDGVAQLGRLDIVCANAGICPCRPGTR